MKKTWLSIVLWGVAAIAVATLLLFVFAPGGVRDPGSTAAGEGTKRAGAESPDPGDTPRDASEPAGEKDFQALADAAMRIRDAERRKAVLAALLAEWLQIDPAGVGKYVMRLEVAGDSTKLDILASAVESALANVSADVATSEAVVEPVRRLILHLARQDPDAALAWANAWLEGETRQAVMVPIARSLAQRSPAAGLQLAASITSPLRRMQAYAVVGGVWAQSDPAAATSWASRLAMPTERAMALDAVLTAIAQQDPGTAAASLATAEQTMAAEYHERYVADLEAMNLTEADLANDRDTYLERLNAGEIPPPTSPDIELMAEAARVIASKLALERGTAGTEWAQALQNEFLRLHGIEGAMAGWSRTDPAAAAVFAATNYPGYQEMLTTVYDVWAGSDPSAAAAGTTLLGDPSLRAVATEAVAKAWAVTDPAQAAAWVDGLPIAEQTDAVRLAVVSGLSTMDPVAAWSRAQAIGDPSLQYRALKAAFAVIVIQKPPETARELLASANLGGRTAERLQEMLAAAEQG